MIIVDVPWDNTGTITWASNNTCDTADTSSTDSWGDGITSNSWGPLDETLDALNEVIAEAAAPWEYQPPPWLLRDPEPQQNKAILMPLTRRSGRRRTATGVINFRRAA